jgi:hypothetical protein
LEPVSVAASQIWPLLIVAVYNMSPELAAALAAYAIAIDGNIVEGVWSIGGPLPADPIPIIGGLLGNGQGLSYSHNNYEGMLAHKALSK